MKLGIPQIIYLGMVMLGLGIQAANHGKPKKGNESFWISLLSSAIVITLLYFGGFFG